MAIYTKRVQTLLTDEEFEELRRLSAKASKPISILIREAVEQVYFEPATLGRRRAALQELLSLESPVSSWEEMEREIIQGANRE